MQREPVTIHRVQEDVAVILSANEYVRLTSTNIEEFNQFYDRIGKRAAERGLTEQKLAELLAEDG